jgi:multidrug efflux pump subunit AcrA (membrane-fusion protein)
MRTLVTILLAALVGAGAAYVVQQQRVDDARSDAEAAREELDGVRTALERSHQEVHDLERRVEGMLATGGDGPDAAIEDGRHPAFLRDVTADELVADVIQWLTGDAANEAAVEEGFIEEGDSVPNDYYIVNDNPMLRTLTIAPDVEVTLATWDCENIPTEKRVSIERFVALFNGIGECIDNLLVNPYWLTVEDGTIVAIEEQYRP